MAGQDITRDQLAELLNEDLAREYQAIIAYVVYSQVLKGAEYMNIADQLVEHAHQELEHALTISRQIDYLGKMPTVTPKPVKVSEKAKDMLRFDLDNENETIINYRAIRIVGASIYFHYVLLGRSDGLNPTNHQWHRIVASPVVSGTTVYGAKPREAAAGHQGRGTGDVTSTHRLWRVQTGPDVPTPVTDGTDPHPSTIAASSIASTRRPGRASTVPCASSPALTARRRCSATKRFTSRARKA